MEQINTKQINTDIDVINERIKELEHERKELVRTKEKLTREEISKKYGNFLYCIEVSSPAVSRGILNYIGFTKTHGCFSSKSKAEERIKRTTTFSEGPRTYHCTVRVKELNEFTTSEIQNINKNPRIYNEYDW